MTIGSKGYPVVRRFYGILHFLQFFNFFSHISLLEGGGGWEQERGVGPSKNWVTWGDIECFARKGG